MRSDVELAAALLAYDRKQAQRIASHRRVVVPPQALIFCPISMAGEDSTIHAVAIGRPRSTEPGIYWTPDPRRRRDAYELYSKIGSGMDHYFADCRSLGIAPQLWVQTPAAVALIEMLAEGLRLLPSTMDPIEFASVWKFGRQLAYFAERSPIAGQQAIHSATSVLRTHYATGQLASDDALLGSMLQWVRGFNTVQQLHDAERQPLGIHPSPEFDADRLAILVANHVRLRKEGANSASLHGATAALEAALTEAVLPIYAAIREATEILTAVDWPPLPGLSELTRIENESFVEWYDYKYAISEQFPIHGSSEQAIYEIEYREWAEENYRAALTIGDNLQRAIGRRTGHVLRATVLSTTQVDFNLRRVEVVTDQAEVRVRAGDRWFWIDQTDLEFSVAEDPVSADHRTSLVFQVAGLLNPDVSLRAGTVAEFVEKVPDWKAWRSRIQGRIANRLQFPRPWTLDASDWDYRDVLPPWSAAEPPGNPL